MAVSNIAAHYASQVEQRVFHQAPGALASWAAIPDSVSHCRAMEVRLALWQGWHSKNSRGATRKLQSMPRDAAEPRIQKQ